MTPPSRAIIVRPITIHERLFMTGRFDARPIVNSLEPGPYYPPATGMDRRFIHHEAEDASLFVDQPLRDTVREELVRQGMDRRFIHHEAEDAPATDKVRHEPLLDSFQIYDPLQGIPRKATWSRRVSPHDDDKGTTEHAVSPMDTVD